MGFPIVIMTALVYCCFILKGHCFFIEKSMFNSIETSILYCFQKEYKNDLLPKLTIFILANYQKIGISYLLKKAQKQAKNLL